MNGWMKGWMDDDKCFDRWSLKLCFTIGEALQLSDWTREEEAEVLEAFFEQCKSAGYHGDVKLHV